MTRSVIVIGAGVVGISCALQMARKGLAVTVVDRGPVGGGTSHGNAGGIIPAAAPIATAGTVKAIPGMLLDRTAALSIRWRDLPRLTPWLLRYLAESRPARAEANSQAIWSLGKGAVPAWRAQMRGTTGDALLRPTGWLKVYESEASFEAAAEGRAFYRRRGAELEELDADALRQMEPNLAPIFARGVLHSDAMSTPNPRRLVELCADAARALGAEIRQAEVTDVAADDHSATVRLADGERLTADRLVLACGAFSKALAARLGVRVPLETERGYHFMFEPPEKNLTRPVMSEDRNLVLSPMETGLRMTSQVELAGLEAPPDYRRLTRMVPLAQRILPSLTGHPRERWLGFRPSLPDSRPVIGPAPGAAAALFAFGHHHYGLSLAARTGEIVAALAADETPDVDLAPFLPDRWS